jgi:hypothetical protein
MPPLEFQAPILKEEKPAEGKDILTVSLRVLSFIK